MDFNVEARRLQLENLKQFISSSKDRVQNILNNLGWNSEEVLQENQLITCSLDTNHKVPPKYVDKHTRKCILRKEDYDLNEQFLSEPQNGIHSINIDDYKKIEILSAAHKVIENFRSGWNGQDPDPKTSDRLISTFSADERLALYNFAVANTTRPPTLPEFDVVNPKRIDDRPLTYEEKLALERDMKRRKIKHKSVHTSHKNHTEVLREVIELEMDLYKDWITASENSVDLTENKCEAETLELEHARSTAASRNSNISSSSRSVRKRYNDKGNEEAANSRSTSRKTSPDKESEKSYAGSMNHRKCRSRSHDSHRRRKEDYRRSANRSDNYHHRDYSLSDRYRRDKYRHRSPRERRSSRDKRHNGYRN